MKILTIEVGQNLFGELEISIHHGGLPHTIVVAGKDLQKVKRDLERSLVVSSRIAIRKFITSFRKSHRAYIPDPAKKRLIELEDLIGKVNSRTRLSTIQLKFIPLLPNLNSLLPRQESRLYRSQKNKVMLIQEVIRFRLSDLDAFVHGKIDSNE